MGTQNVFTRVQNDIFFGLLVCKDNNLYLCSRSQTSQAPSGTNFLLCRACSDTNIT